ncbi:hypothetical protein OH76DRAFT_525199 [Lentinus brumalis]|uniref:Uncharacterized protein n=1 Tax=Lentinus brumalis TaxID=2498619 RepID=A0A371CHN8_9APHY|nr:hypothetical protein OH76DRAFT_525199 [Polyporus brumalis]
MDVLRQGGRTPGGRTAMTSCPSARDRWLLRASMSTAQDATRLDARQAALFAGVCSALPQPRRSRTSEMLAAAPHAARSPQVHVCLQLLCTGSHSSAARPPPRIARCQLQLARCAVPPCMHTRPAFLPSLAATLRYRAQCIAADHGECTSRLASHTHTRVSIAHTSIHVCIRFRARAAAFSSTSLRYRAPLTTCHTPKNTLRTSTLMRITI